MLEKIKNPDPRMEKGNQDFSRRKNKSSDKSSDKIFYASIIASKSETDNNTCNLICPKCKKKEHIRIGDSGCITHAAKYYCAGIWCDGQWIKWISKRDFANLQSRGLV